MRLIDADALLDDVIDRYCRNCDKRKGIKNGKWRIVYEIGDVPCRACVFDDAKDDIENAPTIDVPERNVGEWEKKGKWIKIKEMSWECSVCKKENCYAYHYNDDLSMHVLQDFYCPNCVAKMEGEENE